MAVLEDRHGQPPVGSRYGFAVCVSQTHPAPFAVFAVVKTMTEMLKQYKGLGGKNWLAGNSD